MCGNELGHYYFDSFNVTINDSNMSVEESFNDIIKVYPNPTEDLIYLNLSNRSSINFDIFSQNPYYKL